MVNFFKSSGLLVIILMPVLASAQIREELDFIMASNPVLVQVEKEHTTFNFQETSEIKLVTTGLIRVYQLIISSQQDNRAICTFTPSCSRFGLAAIKNRGALRGIMLTADRLQRCHSFGIREYDLHPVTHKFYDPVENYKVR